MSQKPLALVTGASSGIGADIAKRISRSFRVILVGRKKEKLEATLSTLESEGLLLAVDLADPQSEEVISGFLKDNVPSLSLLVNNAGIYKSGSFAELEVSDWEIQFQTNLFGSVRATRACLPYLKKADTSQIINVSSSLGIRPISGTSAYSATKAAMINWTKTLALELAPEKVRVNCISPGLIETPIHDFHGTTDLQTREQIDTAQPMGFIGQPRHISAMVEQLCSEDSDWITGSNFVIDGGISL